MNHKPKGVCPFKEISKVVGSWNGFVVYSNIDQSRREFAVGSDLGQGAKKTAVKLRGSPGEKWTRSLILRDAWLTAFRWVLSGSGDRQSVVCLSDFPEYNEIQILPSGDVSYT